MTLDRSSRFVRFAYWTRFTDGVPDRTSLCAFFWRAFVIVQIVTAALLCLAGAAVYFAVTNWREVLIGLGIVIGAIAIAAGIDALDRWAKARRFQSKPTREPSVFVAGLKTLKGKVCPLIEFR